MTSGFGFDGQLRSDSAALIIRHGFHYPSERREFEACIRNQREDHSRTPPLAEEVSLQTQ